MQKIKLLLLVFLFLIAPNLVAQDVFIIGKDTFNLQRESTGAINLYSYPNDGKMRFFVQKKKLMLELVDSAGQYRRELNNLTADAAMSADNVAFSLPDLKEFIGGYNAEMKRKEALIPPETGIQHSLSLFTGISNHNYTRNPDNVLTPVLGVEFEFFDPLRAPRHSVFTQLRQSFQNDGYRFNSTQLSINYRFKFLNFEEYCIHIDTELATLSYNKERVNVYNEAGEITAVSNETDFSFNFPISFGIGTDLKVTEVSFITFRYNDVISIFRESNGSFPIDFTLGYKYNL